MDEQTFNSLLEALVKAAPGVGLKAEQIKEIGPGVVVLGSSGITVFWASDAADGRPGWLVRETYQVMNRDKSWRSVTQTVVAVPEDEFVRVSKCALLLVCERRIDSLLNR